MAKENSSSGPLVDLRQRAEQALDIDTVRLHHMSEGEIEALIHELRVHQVELEMQNESLRQAQVDLGQSRTRYAELFDFAPVGYLVFDRNGMVVEANLTATGMLQTERANLTGKAFVQFLQPASRDMWRFHYDAVFKASQAQECELELKRGDKARMIVRLRSQPVKNEKEEVIQWRTSMTSITSSAKAEQWLKDSERRFLALAELSPDAISVERNGTIVFANPTATRLLGAEKPEDIVGRSLLDFIHPDQRKETEEQYAVVRTQRVPLQSAEKRIVRLDGGVLDVEASAMPITFEGGPAIQIVMHDITQQKKADEATSQARRFAESVIDTVQEALLVLNPNLKVISANHTFYDVFQVAPEETQGQYVYEIGHGQWNVPELRRLLEDILPHDTSFEGFEVEHDFDHIGRRTMVLNARRIYSEARETEMILLAMQDITIRKQQEREIHEHQQRLASLIEELLFAEERERHRLAVMLHDSIGQSLAFSRRELGALQKRVAAPMTEAIEDIKKQIDVAIRETRDLTFELSPTTLHTFGLEAAVEELGEQLAQREGFQIHFEVPEERVPVTEQIKTLLYRATRELLMNTAKHADAHNVSVTIDRTDNEIRIRVADDGRGFDVSTLNHGTGEREGLGIFSIRERLINVGGAFHIASEPGKGTEVTLMAPLDVPKGTE